MAEQNDDTAAAAAALAGLSTDQVLELVAANIAKAEGSNQVQRTSATTFVAGLSRTELKAFLHEARPDDYDGRERARAEADRRFGKAGADGIRPGVPEEKSRGRQGGRNTQ